MVKSKTRSYKRKHLKKKHGGDASDWVKQVVGDYPHQAGNGNVIQQNVPSANTFMARGGGGSGSNILSPGNVGELVTGAPSTTRGVTGGNAHKTGGNVISEVAVPAVLLIANQTFRNKTGKKYPSSKRRRFSRRRR